jgi:uncharacterized BrkB/YihY/UPF0761 family membrane protein
VTPPSLTPSPDHEAHGGIPGVAPLLSLRDKIVDVLSRVDLTLLASALTFDALLTVIPLAILVVAGIGHVLQTTSYFSSADPAQLIVRFLPEHIHGGPNDPFTLIENILAKVRGYRTHLTWFAVPAFLWFSTRLFGAIRICLSRIYHVRQRSVHPHLVLSYVLGYLLAKGRDLAMVAVVLVLVIANLILSAGVHLISTQSILLRPPWTWLVTTVGVLSGHLLAIGLGMVLFVALYRYASPRRLRWTSALLAGGIATLGFEIAKWLYGWYLVTAANRGQYSVDADVGAALLLILWIWCMSMVFLVGAAAAEVWEHARALKRNEE